MQGDGPAAIRLVGDAADNLVFVAERLALAAGAAGVGPRLDPIPAAEIRAPAGAVTNVAGAQLSFGSDIFPPRWGKMSALVALNPAALRLHAADLAPGGLLVIDAGAFTPGECHRAGYEADPLPAAGRAANLVALDIGGRVREAAGAYPGAGDLAHCRTMFVLGFALAASGREVAPCEAWVATTFAANPPFRDAAAAALRAGAAACGETRFPAFAGPALPPGRYRRLAGAEAVALAALSLANSGRDALFAATPTPDTADILHHVADARSPDVPAFQAEDAASAAAAALGAAFAGSLAVVALDAAGVLNAAEVVEAAAVAELPLIVVEVRGPGSPFAAHRPDVVVLAPSSPAACFALLLEAAALAATYMTPVVLAVEAGLLKASMAWQVPRPEDIPTVKLRDAAGPNAEADGVPLFHPYRRDDRGSRPWAVPGDDATRHRLHTSEREDASGRVAGSAAAARRSMEIRNRKIAEVASRLAPAVVTGRTSGTLLVTWGMPSPETAAAVLRLDRLHPLPPNLGAVLRRYERVVVAEPPGGVLLRKLRADYLVDAVAAEGSV